MSANSRRRKAGRIAAKLAAWGVYNPERRSWFGPRASRCSAKTCRLSWLHAGNHRDIRGREWRAA